jgi:hypothetical protein
MSLIQKFTEDGSFFEAAPDGAKPRGPLKAPGILSINNTFQNGEYLNNLPGDIDTPDEIARAQDATEGV